MYKIFIDTNIFLDFYRINSRDKINEVLGEIKKYKKYFINTEQSKDEFLRNREKTIDDFVKELEKQNYSVFSNNFIATFSEYTSYAKGIQKANDLTKEMIAKCKDLKAEVQSDAIYEAYFEACNLGSFYERTDKIIDKAIKRKYVGNPPTSSKGTCCDEIIWETLLENCTDDLIIVSRDSTFHQNYNFLKNEYFKKKHRDLKVFHTISDAIRLNGEVVSTELEEIETDMVVADEISKYGVLQDGSNWVSIIYNAIASLGGEAKLKDIYQEATKIISKNYPEKMKNRDKEATMRGILQRFAKADGNRYCFFKKLEPGMWAIIK